MSSVSFGNQIKNLSGSEYFIQLQKWDIMFSKFHFITIIPWNFSFPSSITPVAPWNSIEKNWTSGGRLNKKDGLTRYGDSHVKDKTS